MMFIIYVTAIDRLTSRHFLVFLFSKFRSLRILLFPSFFPLLARSFPLYAPERILCRPPSYPSSLSSPAPSSSAAERREWGLKPWPLFVCPSIGQLTQWWVVFWTRDIPFAAMLARWRGDDCCFVDGGLTGDCCEILAFALTNTVTLTSQRCNLSERFAGLALPASNAKISSTQFRSCLNLLANVNKREGAKHAENWT